MPSCSPQCVSLLFAPPETAGSFFAGGREGFPDIESPGIEKSVDEFREQSDPFFDCQVSDQAICQPPVTVVQEVSLDEGSTIRISQKRLLSFIAPGSGRAGRTITCDKPRPCFWVVHSSCQQRQRPQDFGDAPCLGGAAIRGVRGVGITDLGEGADAVFGEAGRQQCF